MLYQSHRAEFALATEVGGDAFGTTVTGMFQHLLHGCASSFGSFFCRQSEAYFFELLAERLLVCHWRRWVEAFPACAGTCRHP